MADPVNFEDFANFPSDSLLEVKRSLMRVFNSMIIDKILATPESWTGLAGQVMAVASTLDGPTAASLAGAGILLFGNQPVRGFKAGTVFLTAGASLNDTNHGGATLDMDNGSAVNLTVALNANPDSGVSDGFTCEVVRLTGSAAVTIVASTGLTLRNPDAHTRIIDGGVARLRVQGGDLYLWGYTEA